MKKGLAEVAGRFALAAMLGAAGAVLLVPAPAKAADLGGDCCSDLEERGTRGNDRSQGKQEGLGYTLRATKSRGSLVG